VKIYEKLGGNKIIIMRKIYKTKKVNMMCNYIKNKISVSRLMRVAHQTSTPSTFIKDIMLNHMKKIIKIKKK